MTQYGDFFMYWNVHICNKTASIHLRLNCGFSVNSRPRKERHKSKDFYKSKFSKVEAESKQINLSATVNRLFAKQLSSCPTVELIAY